MARPRTPTALKLVKGTARKDRTNKAEPKPRRVIPSPPEHLSDRARTAWGAMSVILDRMGVLTEADAVALEDLCETYAELVEARQALRDRGQATYEGGGEKSGTIYRSYPEVAQVADASRRLMALLTKFGMTPADRSRVSAAGEDDTSDPWADL